MKLFSIIKRFIQKRDTNYVNLQTVLTMDHNYTKTFRYKKEFLELELTYQ